MNSPRFKPTDIVYFYCKDSIICSTIEYVSIKEDIIEYSINGWADLFDENCLYYTFSAAKKAKGDNSKL